MTAETDADAAGGAAPAPFSAAVVGAGPSGFYTAEALLKSCVQCQVDILDALPTPYGLIRFGVAPDHESTKRVMRTYERTLSHERVRFHGNVRLGRDLSIDELRSHYDAVVLAFGASLDRTLGIPGDDKKGNFGAASFVGWYNGHPDFRDLDVELSRGPVVIVGNGNVALDVARILTKTRDEVAKTDLPGFVIDAVEAAGLTDVYILGRRGPFESKWTNKELKEMGQLAAGHPLLDADQLAEGSSEEMSDRDRRLREKNLATLRSFLELGGEGKKVRVHFMFYSKPTEVLGGDRVEGLRVERTRVEAGRAVGTGEFFEIPCGTIIASIGYRGEAVPGIPHDDWSGIVENRDGRVAEGLYVVGWAKRGPTGVIGTNKPDGDLIARHIGADLAGRAEPSHKTGRRGLEALLTERHVRWVSFDDWKRIEAAETAAARPGAPRTKFTRVAEMLELLDAPPG